MNIHFIITVELFDQLLKGVIISGDPLRIHRVMGALFGSITAYAVTTAGT